MKPFELLLYVGSTLSLWFGISVYGLSMYFEKYFKVRNASTKQSLLKRAKRLLMKRPSKVRSGQAMSNQMDSTLNNYRTLYVDGEGSKFKEKLGVNYRANIDFNYGQNIGQYPNQLYKF